MSPEQEGWVEGWILLPLLISSDWEGLEKERKPQRRGGDSLLTRKVCSSCLTSELLWALFCVDTWTAWGRTKDSERLSRLLLPRLITLLFLESAAKLRLSEERDPLEPEQPPSSRWPLGVRVQILGSGERDSLHQELSSSSQDVSKATSASDARSGDLWGRSTDAAHRTA